MISVKFIFYAIKLNFAQTYNLIPSQYPDLMVQNEYVLCEQVAQKNTSNTANSSQQRHDSKSNCRAIISKLGTVFHERWIRSSSAFISLEHQNGKQLIGWDLLDQSYKLFYLTTPAITPVFM